MDIADILFDLARALFALAFQYGGAGLWQALLLWFSGVAA